MKTMNIFNKWFFVVMLMFFSLSFFEQSIGVQASAPMTHYVNVLQDDGDMTQEQIDAFYEQGYPLSLGSEISDNNFYSELLSIVNNLGYSGSTIYSQMFNSITTISIQNKNISSIKGMEHLWLNELKSLTISSNKLEKISADYFTHAGKITQVNFANNQLTECDLSPLKKLTDINISSNKLKSIDLSFVTSENVNIILANNHFSSIATIKIPTRATYITLNIISNNITDISDEYLNLSKLNLVVGVQGLKKIDKDIVFNTTTNIKFFKTKIANFATEIYKSNDLIDEKIMTIVDDEIEGNYLSINLDVGNYYTVYTIDGSEIYDMYNESTLYFLSNQFTIVPDTPMHVLEYKGQQYQTLNKVTGVVKVYLSSTDENMQIFYQVNGGEWIEGSEIVCDQGGNYSIRVKSVIGDFESEEKSIYIRTSLNLLIPDGLMLVLVLFLALALIAFVIPLVSKKFFNKG